MPAALSIKRNDLDFVALRTQVARFAGGGVGESTPTTGLPMADGKAPVGALDLDESGNSASAYTPERTMAASNIDRLSGEILTNLAGLDRLVAQSRKAHPDAWDDAADLALRQRLQNVIDLQRTLATRMDYVAGVYSSNSGVTTFLDPTEMSEFMDALNGMFGGPGTNAQAASTPAAELTPLSQEELAALQHGSPRSVGSELRLQKLALAIEANRLARACNGNAATQSP